MKPQAAQRPLAIDPGSLNPLPVDVISVQSQVVYGCVGNSVALPTLQGGGLNVVAVPTVLLSNTPHYDSLHGGAVPLDWFTGFLADLDRRQALQHARAVLIGYLGSPQQAAALARWLERAISAKPGLKVIVDPVMGDYDSGLYVHPDLPVALGKHLTPLATGLTPNGFELEQLAGRELRTSEAAIAAARELLGGRTEWLIVTSAAPSEADAYRSRTLVVTADDHHEFIWDRIDSGAKGTGDLFTASVTGRLLAGATLLDAVKAAHDHVVKVLQRTARLNCNELVLTVN